MIEEQRICPLNNNLPVKGEYIPQWMQASQHAKYNHALAYAIEQANSEPANHRLLRTDGIVS
jgi:hypothetical protein